MTPRSNEHVRAGGGEAYPYRLVNAQLAIGIDASIWAWPDPPRSWKAVYTGIRDVLRAVRDSDVIHVHQLSSWTTDLAMLLAVTFNKPLVLTDHGGGWKNPTRLLGPRRYRYIDACAAVSRWSLHKDLRWPTSKLSEVIYGGGIGQGERQRPAWPRRVQDFEFDYLYIGRLTKHKGADILVDAARAGNRVKIIGRPVDRDYAVKLRQHADLAASHVEILTDATNEEIVKALDVSQYLIVPTRSQANGKELRRPELLGLVLLEAHERGVPTVSSDAGALLEIQQQVGMPVFVAGNVDSLATTLDLLPQPDSLQYRRLCQQALKSSASYTWAAAAQKCEILYSDLIKN